MQSTSIACLHSSPDWHRKEQVESAMSNRQHTHDWKWALTNNRAVPFLEIQTRHSLVSCLPAAVKESIREYVIFAAKECCKRESSGEIPSGWLELCQLCSAYDHHYSPRWTAPIFYFRGEFSSVFEGKTGLDVGARVHDKESLSKRGLWAMGSKNALLVESLVPHFRHYSNMGCTMRAIDLNAADSARKEIETGDARCLPFAPEFFDFVTVPMLLGHGNPCATYLEIVFCLCELKRVLRPGGFIYIADAGFQPIVGYAGQCLDLQLFVSMGSQNGLPLGLLLRKRKI